jgi:hypothetical protein
MPCHFRYNFTEVLSKADLLVVIELLINPNSRRPYNTLLQHIARFDPVICGQIEVFDDRHWKRCMYPEVLQNGNIMLDPGSLVAPRGVKYVIAWRWEISCIGVFSKISP